MTSTVANLDAWLGNARKRVEAMQLAPMAEQVAASRECPLHRARVRIARRKTRRLVRFDAAKPASPPPGIGISRMRSPRRPRGDQGRRPCPWHGRGSACAGGARPPWPHHRSPWPPARWWRSDRRRKPRALQASGASQYRSRFRKRTCADRPARARIRCLRSAAASAN